MRYVDKVIAQETIERIRDQANLADVIGESVKLERRGRSLLGLCPFHKEKSPSFHVNEDRGFYHCFGCKSSGDVFKFIQETEGLSFIESVRSLAEKMGIEVEDNLSSEERRKQAAEKKREQNLYDVTATAAVFFERMLAEHEDRKFAHDELGRRGLPMDGAASDVLKSFRVGYAPESWDALSSHLRKAGHDLRAAESVGLIAPRRQGQGYYDRFRHRLMFAVIDLHGRVVAFSGRALPPVKAGEEESPAKYYNSPESPIYQKRATVFGLYQARQALRSGNPCVIVEGNFDVVSLHAKGLSQAVAPLGTAFTTEQGRLIRRFTNRVTLLFDGDNAGRKAVVASRDAARDSDLTASVARLPDGMDPDDFSRQRGEEGLKNLLGASRGMTQYMMREIIDDPSSGHDVSALSEKFKQVETLLRAETDPTARTLLQQEATEAFAQALGVGKGGNESTFRALRRRFQSAGRAPQLEGEAGGHFHEHLEPFPSEKLEPVEPRSRLDEAVLGALLDFPELLDSKELLAYSTHMQGDLAAAIATLRMQSDRSGVPLDTTSASPFEHNVADRLPGRVRDFASQRIAVPLHEEVELARVELCANLDKLRRMELSRHAGAAVGEIERARQEGDFDQELELLKEQAKRARAKRGL